MLQSFWCSASRPLMKEKGSFAKMDDGYRREIFSFTDDVDFISIGSVNARKNIIKNQRIKTLTSWSIAPWRRWHSKGISASIHHEVNYTVMTPQLIVVLKKSLFYCVIFSKRQYVTNFLETEYFTVIRPDTTCSTSHRAGTTPSTSHNVGTLRSSNGLAYVLDLSKGRPALLLDSCPGMAHPLDDCIDWETL